MTYQFTSDKRQHPQRGSVIIFVVIFVGIVLVGTASLLRLDTISRNTAQAQNLKILSRHLAEAGAYRGVGQLKTDSADANLAIAGMDNAAFATYAAGAYSTAVNGNTGSQSVDLKSTADGSYQVSSMIRNNTGDMYTIRSQGTYQSASLKTYDTIIELDVAFVFNREKFGRAIISDMLPGTVNDTGKKKAQDGNVVVEVANNPVTIFGGILANGGIYEDNSLELTGANILDYVASEFGAIVDTQKGATADPVPDYTTPGSSDQLFQFDRFIAASDAMNTVSNPTHFTSLDDFVTAIRGGQTFRGITVVDVDMSNYVKYQNGSVEIKNGSAKINAPKLINTSGTDGGGKYYNMPDIHVEGTLLFNYAPDVIVAGVNYGPTPPLTKIFLETGIYVNAPATSDVATYNADTQAYQAALQTWLATTPVVDPPPVVPVGPSNYPMFGTAGYTGPNPWDYDISPAYQNFSAGDDFPAMMYNNGIIDIHSNAYISGVLYTPSFVEMEVKHPGDTQFVSGQIIAGGGVFLEAKSGPLTIVYNENTVDSLATAGTALKSPEVVAWREITP